MEEFLQLAQPTDLFIRQDDINNTPLVKVLDSFVNTNSNLFKSPNVARDLANQARRAVYTYNPPRTIQSLLKKFFNGTFGCMLKHCT